MPDVMTVREVMDKLKCGKSTVYDLFNRGQLSGIRFGRAVRIHACSVAELMRPQVSPRTKKSPPLGADLKGDTRLPAIKKPARFANPDERPNVVK